MNDAIGPVMAVFGVGLFWAWIAWLLTLNRRYSQRLSHVKEFQNRLLDRIGNPEDFNQLLGSESGRRFLETLNPDVGFPTPNLTLRLAQAGIIAFCLGAAFMVLYWMFPMASDWDAQRGNEGFFVFGILVLSVGLGLVICSIVQHVFRSNGR